MSTTRRGKYTDWITEEGLIKIEGWARDGLIDEQIAHNIGIARSTLAGWKNSYPVIAEALKRGKEVVDREVENALYNRALGYTYADEQETIEEDHEGELVSKKTTSQTRHVSGDTTAMIFWLKNRKPEQWRDRKQLDVSGEVNIEDRAKVFGTYLDKYGE